MRGNLLSTMIKKGLMNVAWSKTLMQSRILKNRLKLLSVERYSE